MQLAEISLRQRTFDDAVMLCIDPEASSHCRVVLTDYYSSDSPLCDQTYSHLGDCASKNSKVVKN